MSRSAPEPLLRPPFGYSQLVRFVSAPGAGWRMAALALLLSLPALGVGLAADDYDLAAQVAADRWSAYVFTPRDPTARHAALLASRAAGELPWWTDEHYHQAFMRPLASLSLALDFALWPRAVWFMHLENSLLFALTVSLVWSLYRRVLRDPLATGLATFFYATNPGLAVSVGWLSARNTLLAAACGLLCVELHQRAAGSARAPALRLGAAAALLASLLSAELGVSTLAYLVACEAVSVNDGWRARLLRLAPYFALTLAWRGVYSSAGYGVTGSTFHRDPFVDPLGFAWNLVTGMPSYLASQLTVPLAGLSVLSSGVQLLVAALSLLVLAALRPLFWPLLRGDARARFMALGALLATLPLGATLPQERLVFFVAFGAGGLLALGLSERLAAPARRSAGAVLLFRIHALWLPLGFVPMLFTARGMAAGGGAEQLDRALCAERAAVLLINAPSVLPVHHYGALHRHETGQAPPPVDVLYAGTDSVIVRRVAERVLELRVAGGLLRSPVSGFLRDVRRAPLRTGDVIELPRLRVQVLEARGGDPTRVRFELRSETPLGPVYAWRGRAPGAWPLPALGSEVELPGLSLL